MTRITDIVDHPDGSVHIRLELEAEGQAFSVYTDAELNGLIAAAVAAEREACAAYRKLYDLFGQDGMTDAQFVAAFKCVYLNDCPF